MLLNDMHEDWNERDNDLRPAIAICHTNGKGMWSKAKKAVGITELSCYAKDDAEWAELHVHFNTTTWRPDVDGLIYTDNLFIKELRAWLQTQGFTPEEAKNVDYSEQGMQGDNYVSCDVGEKFLKGWRRYKQ